MSFMSVTCSLLAMSPAEVTCVELSERATTIFGSPAFVTVGGCRMDLYHQMWRLLDWNKLLARRAQVKVDH